MSTKDNLVAYLASLDDLPVLGGHSVMSALRDLTCQQKQREAEVICNKGISAMVKNLHAQGLRYDEILMGMGCSPSQANALIWTKDLLPPNVVELRDAITRKYTLGCDIGLLVNEQGEVISVGYLAKKKQSHCNHWQWPDGRILNCPDIKIHKCDYYWYQTELWYDKHQTVTYTLAKMA